MDKTISFENADTENTKTIPGKAAAMWWWVDRQSKEGSNCKQLVMIATHDREQYNIVVCDGTATTALGCGDIIKTKQQCVPQLIILLLGSGLEITKKHSIKQNAKYSSSYWYIFTLS